MGGTVAIAFKKNNKTKIGVGHKSWATISANAEFLNEDKRFMETLNSEKNLITFIEDNSLMPDSYGLVFVDFDRKEIHI